MGYQYFNEAEITSYKDAAACFAKARKPDAGRPIKQWVRLFKVGDNYEFRFNDMPFAILSPDNILTFPRTPNEMSRMSITFSQASYRVIPVLFQRIATGRYAIEHSLTVDKRLRGNSRYASLRENACEYFAGIQFDMETGACINKRPRLTDCVDDAARKVWLTKLRKFKQGMKVRAKMGVLETICQQVTAERARDRNTWSQPNWSSDTWIDLLYTAMNEEQFPTELLRGFAMSCRISVWRHENPTTKATLEAVESVLNKLSVDLRKRFGVFANGESNG